MKITNRTHWQTAQLRAIISRVAQDELDPPHRKRLRAEVTYNKARGQGGCCSGWAPYHGNFVRLMVPSDTVDRVDFAHLVAHEMAHSRGLHHRDMKTRRYSRKAEGWREYYAWAAELPLERKALKAKPAPMERSTAKLVHALAQLRRWESKVKRASTGARKWRGKVRYYQKQQAVAAMRAQEPEQRIGS